MAQVIYAEEAFADFDRIIAHLLAHAPDSALRALEQIQSAVTVLESHPRIGRRVDRQRRELVISHGASGYLALYRHEVRINSVRILRIRHQREAGYSDPAG